MVFVAALRRGIFAMDREQELVEGRLINAAT